MSGRGKDQCLVAGFVIAGGVRSGAGLGDDLHGPVQKFNHVGDVEVVLIESAEEEDFVFLDGAADRASALLLAAVRLERHEGVGRAESAVADVIESGPVPVIGTGLGDNVDDGAAGASKFCAIGIRGDAKLLHDFVRKLIGSAIKPASLGIKGVVEVAAVDQEAVLESAQAAERKIAVVAERQAARVLRYARRKQHQIREAAAVDGQIGDGAFVEQRRDGGGLSIDELRGAGDGDFFLNAGYGEAEFQFGGRANVDMKLWSDLRRHPRGDDAGGVIAGRQKIDREAAFSIRGCRVTDAGGDIDDCDSRAGDAQVVEINDRAVNGAGSGVLAGGERECKKKENTNAETATEARGIRVPPVVGMRLGSVSPARVPEASGWETRFFCSMKRAGSSRCALVFFWDECQSGNSALLKAVGGMLCSVILGRRDGHSLGPE